MPAPRLLSVLIPCALALVSVTPPVRAQTLAEDSAASPWQHVSQATIALDQALVQQFDWELWTEVRASVESGLAALKEARDAGLDAERAAAIRTTLRAVGTRQELLEREAFAPGEADARFGGDEQAANAFLDEEYAAVAAGLESLADDLSFADGYLPQTTWLRVEILCGLGRDDEAGDALERGLALWPRDARLHESARAWADVLPNPEHVLNVLQGRIDALDVNDADYAGLALETVSELHAAMGRARYAAKDYELAGLHFDRASRALERARSMPRKWSDDEIDGREAQTLVNAAYAYLGLALERWATDRADETAALAAQASEESLTQALRTVPGDPAASDAVLWLGDSLMKKGDESRTSDQDVADMRDFYGRMAERFDVADWWNNYAFWCRETGTSTESQGDTAAAEALYEASYQAYSEAIRLDPENARYVNDTGLMLFYHLDRDMDEAVSLFERAWRLGEEVCNNPFVEPDVFDENFSAYTDAMLNLGKLYTEQQRFDEADDVLNQLIELAPGRLDAMMARRELETVRGADQG